MSKYKQMLACMLIISCAVLMPHGSAMRVKRSHANVTAKVNATAAANDAKQPVEVAVNATEQKPVELGVKEDIASAAAVETVANDKVEGEAAAASNISSVVSAAVVDASADAPVDLGKGSPKVAPLVEVAVDNIAGAQPVVDLPRVRRTKRRMGMYDGKQPPFAHAPGPRRRRHHAPAAVPPYILYNKMVSPDGKQELKEFEVVGPNMMIEGVQQDIDLGTELLPMQIPEEIAIQAEIEKNSQIRPDCPLYQLIDRALDIAMHVNHDALARMANGPAERISDFDNIYAQEMKPKKEVMKRKLRRPKYKEPKEVQIGNNEDELILSCPIHHEQHKNKNGEFIDDDVVVVNECHLA